MINYTEHQTILKADKINLQYGDKIILRDVSFEVKDVHREGFKQGQVVSLIGRSGIGKSQLLKICSGLISPTSGTIKIGNEQKIVKSGDVGVVPQNYILFNHRTVLKNLIIALSQSEQKLTFKEKMELISKFAEDFNLTEHLNKFPMMLSGGQRQRTSILQQILTGNKFIFLDECFSGLDSVMIKKVVSLLVKISLLDELNTLIIISHDIENSMAISDEVLILAKQNGKEGATITETIDLKKEGLAWEPDIKKNSKFIERVNYVKEII